MSPSSALEPAAAAAAAAAAAITDMLSVGRFLRAMLFCSIITALLYHCIVRLDRWKHATRAQRRHVVTPKLLYDIAESYTGGHAAPYHVHPVYDFSTRTIKILRTDGVSLKIDRDFAIPNTRRFHVRFPSSSKFRARYDAELATATNIALRGPAECDDAIARLFDVIERDRLLRADDIVPSREQLWKLWGGRATVELNESNTMTISLGGGGGDPNCRLRVSFSPHIVVHLAHNNDGSVRIVLTRRGPCDTSAPRDAVRYGDYVTYYVNRIKANAVPAPEPTSDEYNQPVDGMRWICRDENDYDPVLTVVPRGDVTESALS